MIYINRKSILEPNVLSLKGSRGRKETALAISFFRNPVNIADGNTFSFKAYKDKSIRDALNNLFNGKCAYCENRIVAITVGDIEHFRPKGGFGKNPRNLTTPGYYWLASNWENLLLSCPNCNRTNTFEIVNIGRLTVGKLNQFPLTNEAYRLRNPLDDFDAEESVRKILDPCKDNPKEHLVYCDDGIILPVKKGRIFSVKGENSIDVFALQRKDLVEEREALIIKIKAQIKSVERAIKIQDKIGVGVIQDVDESLEEELNTLKTYLNPREPFLALARQLINPFIDNII